jgi:hemerythrin-like domain-containing protein
MNSYIELLRNHIEKENNVLFRMADNVLSESDHHTLLGKFADEENKYSSRAKSAVYIQLIRELTSFYKV